MKWGVRPSKPVEHGNHYDLCCSNCNAKLVRIIEIPSDDKSKTKIVKAQCPCGDVSFQKTICGTMKIHALDGYSVKDVKSGESTIIEVVKK